MVKVFSKQLCVPIIKIKVDERPKSESACVRKSNELQETETFLMMVMTHDILWQEDFLCK